MHEPLLSLEQVTVSFDGFKALNSLDFAVQPGGVQVLIGPNGSGKSTLLDTAIGKVRPQSGRVVYQGRDITRYSAHRIARLGIRRKFQTPGVLTRLTVRDNIRVAVRQAKDLWRNLLPGAHAKEEARVHEVLDLIGLLDESSKRGAELSHGQKQWLEIGMVVSSEPDLLLLDEPTAGMTAQESAWTASLIKRLGERHTVLVIDHDMSFVEKLDATISVLHMGRLLKQGDMRSVRNDSEVISVYLGKPMAVAHV